MILSKEVEIVGNPKIFKHYSNLGYNMSAGCVIKVKIEDLTKGSHSLISVKCDVCGTEKMLSYEFYIDNTKNFTEPYCCSRKCGRNKKEQSCLKNNGVKNPSQSKEIKQKKIETCLKNYGVKYPAQNKEIFDKQKKYLF